MRVLAPCLDERPEQLCGIASAVQHDGIGGESEFSLLGIALWLRWISCSTPLHPKTVFWHVRGGFALVIDFPHFLSGFV